MSTSEQDRKSEWLYELSKFIVEANKETWANDKGEIESPLPGMKVHEYRRDPDKYPNDPWYLRDEYAGYFTAPGLTRVWYKDTPAWHMYYGGKGMEPKWDDFTKETFQFLRLALMKVTPELPFRGPKEFDTGNWHYAFMFGRGSLKNDVTECNWIEMIRYKGALHFSQEGYAGIYIHRSEDRQPLYPWNL